MTELQSAIEAWKAVPKWLQGTSLFVVVASMLLGYCVRDWMEPSGQFAEVVLADDIDEVDDCIASSRKEVTIVSNWLPLWISDEALQQALEQGAEVRFVFLDQDADALKMRSLDLGQPEDYGRKRLNASLDRVSTVQRMAGEHGNALAVWMHHTFPSGMIIQCDDTWYEGNYRHGRNVSASFIIRIEDDGSSAAMVLNNEITTMLFQVSKEYHPENRSM